MDFLRIAEESEVCNPLQAKIAKLARIVADAVIQEDGTFDKRKGEELLQTFNPSINGYFDELFVIHVKKVIQFFLTEKLGSLRLRQISFPLANRWCETLVRLSLLYPQTKKLEKRDISVAIVIALLIFLRQSVGSCFAAAPIILVQTEQIEFLFEELYHLLTRGFIQRVIEGEEVRVPMSTKTGALLYTNKALDAYEQEIFKACMHSPILKCYEYTVAGLADWKTHFYKWNMYASLGLSPEEKGGIGKMLYEALNLQLEKTNQEIEALYEEIQQTGNHIRVAEALLRSAYREADIRRHQVEIEVKVHHLRALEDGYHQKGEKAKQLSLFFKYIIEQCVLLFPSYFQEVYDPEMVGEKENAYEDSPAGFRLLFKHGRREPSLWTMIYTKEEYIQFLIEFFQMIEIPLLTACPWEEGKDILRGLIDQVIEKIKEPEYFENACKRVAALQKESGRGIIPRTPWSYSAGGSLEALIKGFFSLKNTPKCQVFKPQKPIDLLIGLIEWMKDLPYEVTSRFEKRKEGALLMLNEVHACTFRPGLDPEFVKAWGFSGNTYTYVRDEIVKRALQEAKKGKVRPLVFADSNWNNDLLGFVVNPQTEEIEIARVTPQGAEALVSWKNLFQGKEWKVFSRLE